ncbi:MAG: trypsin-like serine protease [Dehalococcoidia bacterium]|nr:trypsin-like serine protease [Dehalococcoidia bacterium]
MIECARRVAGSRFRPGAFAIRRLTFSETLLLIGLALLLSFGGGGAGGLVGSRLDRGQPAAATAVAGTPAAPARGVQAAIERALPAIVTVLADLPPVREPDGRTSQQQNIGSGVVVGNAGHIITNYHVIKGAQTIEIMLATGERRRAVAVSDDAPFTDLAVLQVTAQGLRSVIIGDSAALRLGDSVIAAAGSLVGVEHSVSVGVVSALNRSWPRSGVILDDLVQTDAAVNHGDSGGALLNLSGELIGLLTTVVTADAEGRPIRGVAFAQSANSLRPAVEGIIASGRFPRPRIGIERPDEQSVEITPELADANRLPVPFGTLVTAPAPSSRGAAAGLRAGDIVVAVNGAAIDLDHPLPNLLKALKRPANAELLVLRSGRQLSITVSPWEQQ